MLVNLTPHPINFPGETVAPSGTVARVSATTKPVDYIHGIPLVVSTYGNVVGLPEPVDGTIYIVSAMVRTALPNRHDLGSPSDLVRDSAGNIVGCKAIEVNR